MIEDVFVYIVSLPWKIREMVAPGEDGYTIYINEKLDMEGRRKAYRHAMKHVLGADFDREICVSDLEAVRHGGLAYVG